MTPQIGCKMVLDKRRHRSPTENILFRTLRNGHFNKCSTVKLQERNVVADREYLSLAGSKVGSAYFRSSFSKQMCNKSWGEYPSPGQGRGVAHPVLARSTPYLPGWWVQHPVMARRYPTMTWLGEYPILTQLGVPIMTWLGSAPSWGTPPHLGLRYPPGKGSSTSHWGTPRKDTGPVEVLGNGYGVPPRCGLTNKLKM